MPELTQEQFIRLLAQQQGVPPERFGVVTAGSQTANFLSLQTAFSAPPDVRVPVAPAQAFLHGLPRSQASSPPGEFQSLPSRPVAGTSELNLHDPGRCRELNGFLRSEILRNPGMHGVSAGIPSIQTLPVSSSPLLAAEPSILTMHGSPLQSWPVELDGIGMLRSDAGHVVHAKQGEQGEPQGGREVPFDTTPFGPLAKAFATIAALLGIQDPCQKLWLALRFWKFLDAIALLGGGNSSASSVLAGMTWVIIDNALKCFALTEYSGDTTLQTDLLQLLRTFREFVYGPGLDDDEALRTWLDSLGDWFEKNGHSGLRTPGSKFA